MVLLALVREQMPHIPVLYFQGFPHPTKHAFVYDIASRWNLNLVEPPPIAVDAVALGEHVSLLRAYELAHKQFLIMPVEAADGFTPDVQSHCALAELVRPPAPVSSLNYDAVFIGHRGDDTDPLYGAVPLKGDTATVCGFQYLYPLKDWTEADIWKASAVLAIPQNLTRYVGRDMSTNNDYYPLCTECLKPTGRATAFCPQLRRDVPNRGNEMNLDGRRRQYIQTVVNIDKVAGA